VSLGHRPSGTCNRFEDLAMARRCALSGKAVQTGNNVSHANNKSRRRFLPNLQYRRLYSDALGQLVRVRIATATLRTIEKVGGLDAFMADASAEALTLEMARLKKRIEHARAAKAA
jgi:large subunit ribosomal protein L28